MRQRNWRSPSGISHAGSSRFPRNLRPGAHIKGNFFFFFFFCRRGLHELCNDCASGFAALAEINMMPDKENKTGAAGGFYFFIFIFLAAATRRGGGRERFYLFVYFLGGSVHKKKSEKQAPFHRSVFLVRFYCSRYI